MKRRSIRGRAIIPATVLAAAIYFALFGGEYGLFALRELEVQRVNEVRTVEALRVEVDSLRMREDALENDPRTIEEIARERYGMIRPGERLYRFTECEPTPDSIENSTQIECLDQP